MNEDLDIPTLERWTSLARFDHPKDITVGSGRVMWADATTDTSGIMHSEGWVLPGGLRTEDAVTAHAVALSINAMCRED